MKKVILGILAAAILLSASATVAFAGHSRAGRYFVDVDGDGVCDYADGRRAYVDADGDGVCDNSAFAQGQGCGFGHGGHHGGGRAGHGCGFRGGRD